MLKPQQALSATRHDLSRVSRCLLIDIYVRVYIYVYIYMYVCIKPCPCLLPTRLDAVITTNSYVYVVRSHSMSVDLISHFTPQKIFNKSKRHKIEGQKLCPRSLKWSPPQETGPKVLEGSLKKLLFAIFSHPFSVQRCRTSPCCLELLSKSAPLLLARKQSGADP